MLILFSVILAVLGLEELSQRQAIEAAQHCLGPISDHMVYEECKWASRREVHERQYFTPGGAVVYGSRSGSSGKGLELYVSLAGAVTGSNIPAVSEAVSVDAASRSENLTTYSRKLQERADAEAEDLLQGSLLFPVPCRENLTPLLWSGT